MTRAKPDSIKLFLAKTLLFSLLSAVPVMSFAQNSHYDNSNPSENDFFFYDYSEVADTPVLYDSPPSQGQSGKPDLIIIYPSSHDEGSYYIPEPDARIETPKKPDKSSKIKQQRKQTGQNRKKDAIPPGIPAFTSYPEDLKGSPEKIKLQPSKNLQPLPAPVITKKTGLAAETPYVPPVIQNESSLTAHEPEKTKKITPVASPDREIFHKPGEREDVREVEREGEREDGRKNKREEKSEDGTESAAFGDKRQRALTDAIPEKDVRIRTAVDQQTVIDATLSGQDRPETAKGSNASIELPGKEFSAIKPPGKPAMGINEKTVHFYSDPQPLVTAPPPDPDYDPDFADFEASRIIPIIDAPAGFYDFSFEGQGIQIAASHTYSGVEIKAGQVVALNMITTNNSGADRVFKENISGPKGVKGVHEVSAFEVKADKSVSRRISLHLDSTLSAGEHHVSYNVSCGKSPTTSGKLNFTFAIKALPQLAFELIPTSTRLEQNKPFKASGKLLNTGNAGLNIHLKARGRVKNLSVSPIRVSLPAGGHAIVELSGLTPARKNPLDDLLQLTLSAISDKKSGNLQLLEEPLNLRIATQ